MDRQETLHTLQEDVRAAKQRLDATMEKFDAIMRESPAGLPVPDSLESLHNASRELTRAREEHVEAHVRLNAFVAEGIIPDDLKESAGRKEGLGKVKIRRSGE
jgi:hypothetical protein